MFLEVSQLDVRYAGRAQAAVQGVSLGLHAGDIGVLIGPSGSGKSTLLNLVLRLQDPTSGAVRINDAVIDDEKLMLGDNALLEEGVIKLSVGKKRHALVKAG